MSVRESAIEENRLSALSGIRNAVDQTASLRTQLAAKDAEIERREADRFELVKDKATKDAQIEALQRALRPFAEAGKRLPDVCRDHETHWSNWEQGLTAGDLRAARAALEVSGGVATHSKTEYVQPDPAEAMRAKIVAKLRERADEAELNGSRYAGGHKRRSPIALAFDEAAGIVAALKGNGEGR